MWAAILSWLSMMRTGFTALSVCPRSDADERALCLPTMISDVLTGAEARAIIDAAEAALAARGSTGASPAEVGLAALSARGAPSPFH